MAETERMEVNVSIPAGTNVTVHGSRLTIKGKKGELQRTFEHPRIDVKIKDGSIHIVTGSKKKADKALIGTWSSHMRNMINGVNNGYQYKMRIIFSHFPIKTSVKGSELLIENFIGERFARKANILEGVTVKISGESITLEGISKEMVGQTAANIEKATQIRDYDPRVFQDGIYLVSRGDE
ncbi:MAG: 50S ribosomal protein L6 [Candidatus Thermoplasmatota archaeon]|jgi:large subunit ribosomal protein L6|nr:50S ribosomal protein L6 [Candidatus Thermoplasmatota archaeon]